MQFIIGIIFGIVIATVGFSGIANMMDHGVNGIKYQAKELSQWPKQKLQTVLIWNNKF